MRKYIKFSTGYKIKFDFAKNILKCKIVRCYSIVKHETRIFCQLDSLTDSGVQHLRSQIFKFYAFYTIWKGA